MSVVAHVALQTGPVDYLSDEEFSANAELIKKVAETPRAPFGRLTVVDSAGVSIELYDQLVPMATCLKVSLRELQEQGETCFSSFSQPNSWQMTKKADQVEIIADRKAVRNFPANELIAALQASLRTIEQLIKQFPERTIPA